MELHPRSEERAEGLPGLPREVNECPPRWRPLPELVADRAAQTSAHGPVTVVDGVRELDIPTGPHGVPRVLVQTVAELGTGSLEFDVRDEPAVAVDRRQERREVNRIRP